MTDWKKYKLSDFIQINPSIKLFKGNEYSFVEMKDLSEGQRYVLPSQTKELKGGTRFQNGDTLFARITPCLENGKICQVKGLKNGIGFGSTEFLVFRGIDGLSDSDFIFYLSRYDVFRKFAEQNMVGTSGRQRVSKEAFNKIELKLPPLPTQTAIAEILSSLDDKIELNNAINKNLEDLAQALFKRWFVDFEFPNEEGLPYQSSGGEMVESEIGEIPGGWKIKSLSDILINKKESTKPGSHLCLRRYVPIDKMTIKALVINDFLPFHEAKSSLLLFDKGDIILGAMRVYFHRVNYAPFNGVTRTTCFVLKPKIENDLGYVLLLLNQADTIEYANSTSKGTTMPYAVWENGLAKMTVRYPVQNILERFNNIIGGLLESISNNNLENKKLINIRDALLPKLISGELEVNQALSETEKAL